MSAQRSPSRRKRGTATAPALVLVIVCAAIASGAVLSNAGATREAETVLARERAFQAAEAGLDWAITRLRINHGAVPSPADETGEVDSTASYVIRYERGNEDGIDENGDGVVDDAGESEFTVATSTGISGGVRRSVQAILCRAVQVPSFPGGALINDDTAILDLNGNAFDISGADHFIDGTVDPSMPEVFGIASAAPATDLIAQIDASRWTQVVGEGGVPAVGQTALIDLATLMDQASQAATIVLEPGTHANAVLGTPTEDGIEVVVCHGDLHLSGGATGAGVLVVEGDLDISGGFEWTGIILVGGRTTNLTGGGGGTRLVGAMVTTEELRTTGTVDILYSSHAIALATLGLAIPVVVTWRETGGL